MPPDRKIQPGLGGPRISMSSRHNEARSNLESPGPGAYNIASTFGKSAQASAFHSRNGDVIGVITDSPGPGAYLPDTNSVKPKAPSASMHIRTKAIEPEETPGYVDLGSTLTGPKYTIGRRESGELVAI